MVSVNPMMVVLGRGIGRTALSLSDARPSSHLFLPSFCAFKFSCFFFSISSERPSVSSTC
jgi:hypothetical protein